MKRRDGYGKKVIKGQGRQLRGTKVDALKNSARTLFYIKAPGPTERAEKSAKCFPMPMGVNRNET